MGYNETYKRNCNELADFVFKRQEAERNAAQETFKELKEKLDNKKESE